MKVITKRPQRELQRFLSQGKSLSTLRSSPISQLFFFFFPKSITLFPHLYCSTLFLIVNLFLSEGYKTYA